MLQEIIQTLYRKDLSDVQVNRFLQCKADSLLEPHEVDYLEDFIKQNIVDYSKVLEENQRNSQLEIAKIVKQLETDNPDYLEVIENIYLAYCKMENLSHVVEQTILSNNVL